MHSAPGMILKSGNIYYQSDINLARTVSTFCSKSDNSAGNFFFAPTRAKKGKFA
jgi:hypothetical protein